MGWQLNTAEHKELYLTEQDLWRHVQQFLVNSKHTTAHKLILMKALLESLPEIDSEGKLKFIDISKHVTKIFWNLVIKYDFHLLNDKNKENSCSKIIKNAQQNFQIPSEWNFDKIQKNIQEIIVKDINKDYKKYVYGSFYDSFNGTIYSFNKKEEWIKLNPPYINFFERYKRILITITNYQLALFIEKFNESNKVERLLEKVEFVSMRQSLKEFQQLLASYGDLECFYCGKSTNKLEVDHFVPWSYVQNDVLWNFVFACKSCNSKKNNKIADSKFLEKLIDRNEKWVVYEEMGTYNVSKLENMYNYAIENGYESNWLPKIKV